MTAELGTYGIWRHARGLTPELAAEVERLGFTTLWVGGSPPADLDLVESLLAATDRITVATGITNIWTASADEVGASYHRLEKRFPGRFLLGVGIGHPEAVSDYRRPYASTVDYLDRLDSAGVPPAGRVLAALGPRMLALAGERAAGAHPYLTTPEHTRQARAVIGPDALLAPEHKVVLDTDPERARSVGRPAVDKPYLGLRNYTSNLERLGWTKADLADGGSDALIDALVAHGTADAVAARITEHVEAGADHVCAQVLSAGSEDPVPAMAALAGALRLG